MIAGGGDYCEVAASKKRIGRNSADSGWWCFNPRVLCFPHGGGGVSPGFPSVGGVRVWPRAVYSLWESPEETRRSRQGREREEGGSARGSLEEEIQCPLLLEGRDSR
jgi:hypothetical protein